MKIQRARIRTVLIVLLTAAPLLTPAAAFAGVNRWTSSGPDGGTVSALVIDPTNPGIVYASNSRGVFKSINAGRNWREAAPGLSSPSATTLLIDPSTPSTIYAGGMGVSKSLDGGETWDALGLQSGLGTQWITTLAIDPVTPANVYAGTENYALYKSTNGGANWNKTLAALVYALVFKPAQPSEPSELWAADYEYPGIPGPFYGSALFKSLDAGATWGQSGVIATGASVSAGALVIDQTRPAIAYAGTQSGLYKSVDAGVTWTRSSANINNPFVTAIAIDPRNPDTLYAGTYSQGVFRSTDGGTSWAPFNLGLTNLRVIALAIDGSGNHLHAGTASGVFDLEVASVLFDVSVAQDGNTRFFSFDVSSGRIVLGAMNPSGPPVLSQPYGPYNGWTPRASADGNDAVTRILWTHEDGSAALWLAGPLGVQASFRCEGAAGLTATDVAAGADTHILWTNTDGTAVLQTIDASGGIARSLSFGPYDGWSATAIADGPDGVTRVLWNNNDGRAGLSFVSADGFVTTARYGRFPGWTALDVAVGGDGLTRILWAHKEGRIALGIVDAAGEVTTYGPVYPAPAGFTARRLASGPDGSSRVLFSDLKGNATLWQMSADGAFVGSITLAAVQKSPPPGIPSGTGSVTRTSSLTSHSLCPEITRQVGMTYPLSPTLKVSAYSLAVSVAHDPTSNDPIAEYATGRRDSEGDL